jgi:hypothetical protein
MYVYIFIYKSLQHNILDEGNRSQDDKPKK